MGIEQHRLSGGGYVHLATWDDMKPTVHGAELQARAWNPNASRTGLAFYDSTVHYMRNDWAQQHMDVVPVALGDKPVLLFRNRESDTWHTAEALDIDHVQPWKQHLTDLGARSQADAHIGYNDVGNLRALPSAINRGRAAAERALGEGVGSDAWKDWSDRHFHFDPGADHAPFDPVRDAARRTTTRFQDWTMEDGRGVLSFDTRVEGKWFENQLAQQYRGTVSIDDGQDYYREIPLFECPATGQLVTRDGFDIDHVRPFEDVARATLEARGGVITKAEALDLYNDTGNLRLVSRGANCSHEWELDIHGEYLDRGEREHEEPENELDRAFVETGPDSPQDLQALDELRGWLDRHPQPAQDDAMHDDQRPVHVLQPRYALGNPRNPDSPLYNAIHAEVAGHDRQNGLGLSADETANVAAALTLAVRNEGWAQASGVAYNPQQQTFYAYTGQPDAWQHTEVSLQQGRQQPANDSGRELHQLRHDPQQAQPGVQAMDTQQRDGRPMAM